MKETFAESAAAESAPATTSSLQLEPCTSAHDAEASRPSKEEESCDEGIR
ncbi:MAG TPA: hypothetical protein VIO60_06150 [Rectinemataceae bacterium]